MGMVGYDGTSLPRDLMAGRALDHEVLRQALLANPGSQSVIIRAHKDTLWESVVRVMDLCNKTGIRNYRVTTSDD